MSNLQRTFNPKYSHYLGDGSGRDTYVIKNNGGLCIEAERAKYESSQFFTKRVNTSPHPQKESPAFKYISDGSGRDSYVLINSGGLHSPSVYGAHKNVFQNTLRNSPKILWRRNKSQKDLYDYQSFVSHTHSQQTRETVSQQKDQSQRLSTPKFVIDKRMSLQNYNVPLQDQVRSRKASLNQNEDSQQQSTRYESGNYQTQPILRNLSKNSLLIPKQDDGFKQLISKDHFQALMKKNASIIQAHPSLSKGSDRGRNQPEISLRQSTLKSEQSLNNLKQSQNLFKVSDMDKEYLKRGSKKQQQMGNDSQALQAQGSNSTRNVLLNQNTIDLLKKNYLRNNLNSQQQL